MNILIKLYNAYIRKFFTHKTPVKSEAATEIKKVVEKTKETIKEEIQLGLDGIIAIINFNGNMTKVSI